MNISFKANFEMDNGETTPKSVRDFYDKNIDNLKRKKELSLKTIDYLNSPEIKAKLRQLPKEDVVILNTLTNPADEDNCIEDSLELMYYSEDQNTNEKLGLYKGDEFLLEHKIDSSSDKLDKDGIKGWLDKIVKTLN